MNTVRDASEGRAKPSVWPVHVAAGPIVVASVAVVLTTPFVHSVTVNAVCMIGLIMALALGRILPNPWKWWGVCG